MDTNKLERLAREGQLAETRGKLKEFELRLTYIRDALRKELDPFEPVENLNAEAIKLIASDLVKHHREYRKLLEIEKKLCEAMGKEPNER
jgi:hypothetical protein